MVLVSRGGFSKVFKDFFPSEGRKNFNTWFIEGKDF
jgi:hypothetical protein